MSKVWFTADHHFGHANIIKLCNRPFQSADEMDRILINNWNAVVGRNDVVYHLGDFAYHADQRTTRRIFSQLAGQKFLITGNHDSAHTKALTWSAVDQIREVAVDGQRLVLCHFAMRSWNALHRGSINLYGHSHGKLPGTYHSQDVGVDDWEFSPVSWPDIKARLDARPRPEAPEEIDEAAQPGGLTI